MDPNGKRDYRSARTKITKEESEEPKEAETEKHQKKMEVGEAALHEASAEIRSPKSDSGRIRRNARLRKWASCQAPLQSMQ